MKSAKATKRQVHRQNSRPSIQRARQVRRAAEFKLESLEERTLLSTTKVIPPPSVPLGLGASYTTLSEQAHGVGLNGQFAHSVHRRHDATSSRPRR